MQGHRCELCMKGRGECCGGRGRLGAEVRAVDKRGEAVCRGEFVGGDGWGGARWEGCKGESRG